MNLTQEQTLQLYCNVSKTAAFKHRFKYSTKYKWYCLSCLTPLYISYRQYGRNSIFCWDCYMKNYYFPSIVQVQYMRALKDRQLKLIEKFVKSNIKIDLDTLNNI